MLEERIDLKGLEMLGPTQTAQMLEMVMIALFPVGLWELSVNPKRLLVKMALSHGAENLPDVRRALSSLEIDLKRYVATQIAEGNRR